MAATTESPATEVPTLGGPKPSDGADPRRWVAFAIMTIATFMDMLDGSIVNVALPTIQQDLAATYREVQWISAGYVLLFALLLITGGRLGDIFGRRRVFQLGVAGFTLASLACGLADDATVLIIARLIQGASAGIMIPQVLAIVHVTFPNKEKAMVYAIYGTIGGLAATIAPLVGAVLVSWDVFGLDWRPIFLVNVPIGIAGLLLGQKYIPESKAVERIRLDLVGVFLASSALLLLLVPLTLGREIGWPVWTFVAMAMAFVALGAFVTYERAKERSDGAPLVPLGLFRARSFSAALALTLACFTFTGLFMLAIYLFMQIGLGWSPLHAGLTMLAFAVGAFVTASLSVVALVPKFGRTVLQVGSVAMMVGLLLFWWTNTGDAGDLSSWKMAPALFIIGLGFGSAATPASMFALSDVPFEDAGAGSGLLNTMMQLGFALGIAATSLAFFSPLSSASEQTVTELAPGLHQELIAVGLSTSDADSVVDSFGTCVQDQFSGTTPQADPASCTPHSATANSQEAQEVVQKYTTSAHQDVFATSMNVTVMVGVALAFLALIAASALPRRAPDAEEFLEEGDLEQAVS